MTESRSKLLMGIYFLAACVFAFWSYSLTDPNLVLTSFAPYWTVQQWLWKHIWQQPVILSSMYAAMMVIWFGSYAALITQFSRQKIAVKTYQLALIGTGAVLLLAYNALSHDIFNYIFNAKMVLVYHFDPHVHTAIEFPQDLWTRFMHNTHTPAPYGYGWTAFSVVPFFFTQVSFVLSWLAFKALNVIALILLWLILFECNKKYFHFTAQDFNQKMFVLFANPLILIETLANGHNDLWMMVPTLFAVLMLITFQKTHQVHQLLIAIISFLFSLSTKWATLAVTPILLGLANWTWLKQIADRLPRLFRQMAHYFELNWPLLASVSMFLPLLTDRSQQFHPWYLIWPLVWLPMMRRQIWFELVLIFSFSSMMRYIPWMLAGGYSDQVLFTQRIITWGIPAVWLIMKFVYAKIAPSK